MPKHRINTRVQFIEVLADDELVGTLFVSRGSVDWRPRGSWYVYKLGWDQFDRLMQDHGTAVKVARKRRPSD